MNLMPKLRYFRVLASLEFDHFVVSHGGFNYFVYC